MGSEGGENVVTTSAHHWSAFGGMGSVVQVGLGRESFRKTLGQRGEE